MKNTTTPSSPNTINTTLPLSNKIIGTVAHNTFTLHYPLKNLFTQLHHL